MSEDKLQASISRAARAEALLKNELLQEAFTKLEDDYTAAWKTWPAGLEAVRAIAYRSSRRRRQRRRARGPGSRG